MGKDVIGLVIRNKYLMNVIECEDVNDNIFFLEVVSKLYSLMY